MNEKRERRRKIKGKGGKSKLLNWSRKSSKEEVKSTREEKETFKVER